jgi:hypothetical protein
VQGSKLNPLEPLTPPLTADFTTSTKVDVDKSVLEGETKGWYDETEEEKAEKTRAKEAREAIKNAANKEAREGRQNAIGEANLIAKQLREKREKDEKDEKQRKKDEKEERKRVKEEKKVANALAALEVPTSKGVRWDRRRSCWKVQLSAHGKKWHLGQFGFDDHTKAVAAYSNHKSMTKTELEALDKRR